MYDHLGAVQPPSVWFDSGCGAGPRVRWLADGKIEVEGLGVPTESLPKAVPQWGGLIAQAAAKYSVPAQLIAGVMATESSGKQKALSYANAAGLMQLLPSTATGLAKRPVSANELMNDPALNVDLGVKYMRELWDKYKGNPIKIAAAYNAGSAICGAPKKCPDGPNQWNIVADCDGPSGVGGKAVDYPMRMFKYSNAALGAGVGVASAGTSSSKGSSWLPVAAGLALVVGAVVLTRRSA